MKKSNVFLILALFLLITSFDKKSVQKHIRTDGYYLFDNGLDTFALIPGSKELYKSSYKFLEKQFGIKPRSHNDCLPDSMAFYGDSSTQLFYLAFFENNAGTAFVDVCRNREGRRKAISDIKNRAANIDTQYAYVNVVFDAHYKNDSTITYQVSKIDYQHEYCEGTIFGNGDSIRIHCIRTQFPQINNSRWSTRQYKFIPYPPNH